VYFVPSLIQSSIAGGTMNAYISRTLCAILVLGFVSCTTKVENAKIPITTSSEEARKEFLEGRSLAEKLQATNSLQHFERAIALDSNFATAYVNRANASFIAKDFFSNLTKAVAASAQCSEGERLLILATEAGAYGKLVEQKAYLDSLMKYYPRDERVQFAMGGYYFGLQDYTPAIEHYQKAIQIAPEYSPVYNILGYAYRQTENYTEAEKTFKKYIELIPNDPNPYDSYAELLMKIGRFDESIANYQKALALDPNFIASRFGIAANYMYKGMHEKGAAELDTLARLARNDGERRTKHFTQVILSVDAGNMDAAIKELALQYQIAEKNGDAAAMAGDIGLKANILLEMGKFQEALTAYEMSAQILTASNLSKKVKDNAELFLHYNRAQTAIARKDLKTAKKETEEFRSKAEANKNVNQTRLGHELAGLIAMVEKKSALAVDELLQANQQNPYNLYRLALEYQMLGDKAKAKVYCTKAAHFNGVPALNYAFIRTRAEKMLSTLK
jgi:tetratricopeptide (TPR) repeat protein